MSSLERPTGPWKLSEAKFPKDRGRVFSCFACAGGSTMGYKLAGFDVIGCNEIDPTVFQIYERNHHPRFSFVCSIRDMLKKDLPKELHQLDILDGSPPCTSFSTAGVRDRDWGKAKHFREGDTLQRLDDLFFEFIALAKRLQPKTVIAENVTGIVKGKAKGYIKEIIQGFSQAGYRTQIFKLNAAQMGVPQARVRVFFVARRNDMNLPPIRLRFNEKPITFKQASNTIKNRKKDNTAISKWAHQLWTKVKQGQQFSKAHPTGAMWNHVRVSNSKPCPTLPAGHGVTYHSTEPRFIDLSEWIACSSFPIDMNWDGWSPSRAKWAIGMSVPPFMMQRIALEVDRQWGHAFEGGSNAER